MKDTTQIIIAIALSLFCGTFIFLLAYYKTLKEVQIDNLVEEQGDK